MIRTTNVNFINGFDTSFSEKDVLIFYLQDKKNTPVIINITPKISYLVILSLSIK
jgi:hypothetical protein